MQERQKKTCLDVCPKSWLHGVVALSAEVRRHPLRGRGEPALQEQAVRHPDLGEHNQAQRGEWLMGDFQLLPDTIHSLLEGSEKSCSFQGRMYDFILNILMSAGCLLAEAWPGMFSGWNHSRTFWSGYKSHHCQPLLKAGISLTLCVPWNRLTYISICWC